MNKQKSRKLLVLSIIFIAFNLRTAITMVGPITDLLQKQFTLNSTMAGFITTLPLVTFALISPFVAKLSRKTGYGRTMLAGLLLIMAGELIRSYTNSTGLFIGTAVMGSGMAIGNVLIPSIIKQEFPEKIGRLTSIYVTSMCLFASLGAGTSIPLTQSMQFSWNNALALPAILAVITIILWLPQLQTPKESRQQQAQSKQQSGKSIWRSPLAWWVTLFMGVQSLLFYSFVAWIPAIIMERVGDPSFAGNMAFLFQIVGLPVTLVMPMIAVRYSNQRLLGCIKATIYLSGTMGLYLATSKLGITAATILLSIGQGGSISLAIAFISLRTPHAQKAAELSGMAQSAGYAVAAIGPTLLGALYGASNSWDTPLMLLIAANISLFLLVYKAGSNKLTHS